MKKKSKLRISKCCLTFVRSISLLQVKVEKSKMKEKGKRHLQSSLFSYLSLTPPCRGSVRRPSFRRGRRSLLRFAFFSLFQLLSSVKITKKVLHLLVSRMPLIACYLDSFLITVKLILIMVFSFYFLKYMPNTKSE